MPALTLTMGNLGPRLRARAGFIATTSKIAVRAPFVGALALACGACGGGAAPSAQPAVPERVATLPPAETFDRDWAERTIWRVPVRVALPEARAWRASTSGTFTLLAHPRTQSSLALRVTLAPRLVRPEECEAEARLARPSLPRPEPSTIVEQRVLQVPSGFDVRLTVGVEAEPGGVHGYALAVGAATGRCYVAAFETTSFGPKAAERVADRLAVVVSGVLETMTVPNSERRVPPPTGVK
jgi:hypothetical protein